MLVKASVHRLSLQHHRRKRLTTVLETLIPLNCFPLTRCSATAQSELEGCRRHKPLRVVSFRSEETSSSHVVLCTHYPYYLPSWLTVSGLDRRMKCALANSDRTDLSLTVAHNSTAVSPFYACGTETFLYLVAELFPPLGEMLNYLNRSLH